MTYDEFDTIYQLLDLDETDHVDALAALVHPRTGVKPEGGLRFEHEVQEDGETTIVWGGATCLFVVDVPREGSVAVHNPDDWDAIQNEPKPDRRTPSEIEAAIGEALGSNNFDSDWWNGASAEARNEYVILAQREGFETAMDALEGIGDPDED